MKYSSRCTAKRHKFMNKVSEEFRAMHRLIDYGNSIGLIVFCYHRTDAISLHPQKIERNGDQHGRQYNYRRMFFSS